MTIKDQLSRLIHIDRPCRRIVSLVPSITELLVDLGLSDRIVGVTKFCVHPSGLKQSKTVIGGTKQVHIQMIKDLQPDLVLANKEENVQEQIEEIALFCPTYVSDINNVQQVLALVNDLAHICQGVQDASKISRLIGQHAPKSIFDSQRALYLIWKDPYMSVGGDTYISYVMNQLGLVNVCQERDRYPSIVMEEIIEMNVDCIFLSSEPYPFSEKHRLYFTEQLPHIQTALVDGEAFSWYGSRLIHLPAYFTSLKSVLLSKPK